MTRSSCLKRAVDRMELRRGWAGPVIMTTDRIHHKPSIERDKLSLRPVVCLTYLPCSVVVPYHDGSQIPLDR